MVLIENGDKFMVMSTKIRLQGLKTKENGSLAEKAWKKK